MGSDSGAEAAVDPRTSPWLTIAGDVGRASGAFMMGAGLVYLLAPVSYLLGVPSALDPRSGVGALLTLLSDPVRLITVGDFVSILGVVILAFALLLVLVGLLRAERDVSLGVFLPGCVSFACLVAWAPIMLYAQGRARGTLGSVDAVAATGGWGIASILMLAASLAYLMLTIRVEEGGERELTSLMWPVYAAVNVLGSVAFAGFFVEAVGGPGTLGVFTLGLVLKVSLIPVLGILAFADLRRRFPAWAGVVVARIARRGSPRTHQVPRSAKPIPPPPDD